MAWTHLSYAIGNALEDLATGFRFSVVMKTCSSNQDCNELTGKDSDKCN